MDLPNETDYFGADNIVIDLLDLTLSHAVRPGSKAGLALNHFETIDQQQHLL